MDEEQNKKDKELSLDDFHKKIEQIEEEGIQYLNQISQQVAQHIKDAEKAESSLIDSMQDPKNRTITFPLFLAEKNRSFLNSIKAMLILFEERRISYNKALRQYTKAIQDKQEKIQVRQDKQDHERHILTMKLTMLGIITGIFFALVVAFVSPLIAELYQRLSALEIGMLVCAVVLGGMLLVIMLCRALGILK